MGPECSAACMRHVMVLGYLGGYRNFNDVRERTSRPSPLAVSHTTIPYFCSPPISFYIPKPFLPSVSRNLIPKHLHPPVHSFLNRSESKASSPSRPPRHLLPPLEEHNLSNNRLNQTSAFENRSRWRIRIRTSSTSTARKFNRLVTRLVRKMTIVFRRQMPWQVLRFPLNLLLAHISYFGPPRFMPVRFPAL